MLEKSFLFNLNSMVAIAYVVNPTLRQKDDLT